MSRAIDPASVALDDGQRLWTYADLDAEVASLAKCLRAQGTRVVATLLDNSPAWVIADLAASRAQVVHVPLPVFFTPEQIAYALSAASVDTVLALPVLAARWPQWPSLEVRVGAQTLAMLRLPVREARLPAGTAKITFTSGTTGAPKGVCLDEAAMQRVAQGLVQAMEPLDIRRHLCALPFAVLLENIAGLMAPLLRGATSIALPLQSIGLSGSSSFDAARFHEAVATHQPHSIILLPQMLRVWVGYLAQSGERVPASLRMVAVGGAAVGVKLVHAARALGIPAYEGYGLSEGASVQTLNVPGSDRPGTAGRALPIANCALPTMARSK